jgi:peptidoglycan/xylan/chitin deacetylase (PgdA/CDA1 family)
MFAIRTRLRVARRRLLRKVWRRPAPLILMYHRVAEPAYDPWGLAVSPANFADQLRWLARGRQLVAVDTLVDALRSGELTGREVGITFDDGYVDNLTVAKPLLERVGAPATVFITTQRLGATDEFWWDELSHMCLGADGAVDAEVEVAGKKLRIKLDAHEPSTAKGWLWNAPTTTEHERIYLELWRLLQRLDEGARSEAMTLLRQRLGTNRAANENLPMRPEHVATLVDGGLIRVGGHGRNHVALSALSSDAKRGEIELCKRELERLTQLPISGFAYPFGDRDEEAKAFTRQAGYGWAVSTRTSTIDPDSYDLFDLPRLQVLNWSGGELMRQISQLERAA